MRIVRFVFIGVFLISFLTVKGQLENDPYVKKVFNSEEIKSLNKLLSFVDKQVLLKTNKEEIEEAYHALFDSLQTYITKNEKDKIPMEEHLRVEIFKVLKQDGIFNEIFVEDIPIKVYMNGEEFENPEWLETVYINSNGKYRKLIKNLSHVDTAFKYVNESFENTGDFAPSYAAGLICNSENYDFSIERIRLFGAVFYLTREVTLQTRHERYLKNKK